jgi:hypothetical protein
LDPLPTCLRLALHGMIVICDRTGEIGSWKEPFVVPCSRSLRAAMKLVVCAFQILDLSYHLTSIRMVRVDVSSRRSSRVKPFQIPTIVKLSLCLLSLPFICERRQSGRLVVARRSRNSSPVPDATVKAE